MSERVKINNYFMESMSKKYKYKNRFIKIKFIYII